MLKYDCMNGMECGAWRVQQNACKGSIASNHLVSSVCLGSLLSKVSWEWDEYDDIQRKVTAKAIMNDKDPLLLAVKVSG